MIPEDLKYTETHEWVRNDNGVAVIGITDFAQQQLTDIVFVELPETEEDIERGEECGVVESPKTAADLYAPVSGTIVAVNEELTDHPEYINQDPYGKGWIVKIEMTDPSELDHLMDASAYSSHMENSK